MASLMMEAFGTLRPIEITTCAPCHLFWFDKAESIRLTPKAVLELFQYIGQAGSARKALATTFGCPLCGKALALTQDLQRTTRFAYWRCRNDHGRLITFHQFLREKNFIRAPSPAELARLRATVRQISCSQCGAPVDLAADTACKHCGAAVALIDPEGVAKAVRELAAGVRARAVGFGSDAHDAERRADRRDLRAPAHAPKRERRRPRRDRRGGDRGAGRAFAAVDLSLSA